MSYIIPSIIIITLFVGAIKKISVYDSFVVGIKEALALTISLLPYLVSIFMLIEIFKISGLSQKISDFLAIPLGFFGIPKELCELLILRPLSGTGSLAVVENIYATYGVDSYVARCASVIMASNDTIFYIVAVYMSSCKDKSTGIAIPISIFSSFLGAILSCMLCKIM